MYKIAVIGGDGTGPEVVAEALKCLHAVSKIHNIAFSFTELPYDAKRYLQTGITLTDVEISHLKTYDAILFGAIGSPDVKPGVLERGILLKMRFDLDQYINLRPVRLYENVYTPIKGVTPQDIDYVVIRENTGDLYTGQGGIIDKDLPSEITEQKMLYTRKQVERCVRYAFQYTEKRHKDAPWKGLSDAEVKAGYRGKLTLCGKSNVLLYAFDLWQRVIAEVSKEYPSIITDYVHVDATCIYMVECPQRFDVIVTTNMFGDIITDLAAVTQGGMGVASSGNLNPEGVSMFEPIGGTAPSFTGLNQINPMAAIGAAHMMLSHLGEDKAAKHLEEAKIKVIQTMESMAAGKMGASTTQIGDRVVEALNA